MKHEKTKLDIAVEKLTRILEIHMANLPKYESKAMRKSIRQLAAKCERRVREGRIRRVR